MLLLALASLLTIATEPTATVVAARADRAPRLDTTDERTFWAPLPRVAAFTQWSPRENTAPSFRTEFSVAYDSRNLYVFVRAFDPHPDSIVRTVTRRDGTSASDEIGVYLSTSGDHRSGYEFYVNAAGVERDVAISGDTREDITWDAVWNAVTHVDSLGWTAEFRIPFSQLRFAPAEHHQFGVLVNRSIQRRAENDSWPAYHPSRTGIVSQFGVLDGLDGLSAQRAIEASPFVRTDTRGGFAAGGDLRIGLTPNFSFNATALPDFGQVEADPSVVNLSPAETFFAEQRPFFVEGAGAYNVSFNCNAVNCGSDALFYSRRIGRAPELIGVYGDDGAPDAVAILGAAKLTGRTASGFTVAAMTATTERAVSEGRTVEPTTEYGIARVQRDFRNGQSGVSAIATVVDRSLDSWSVPYLARRAIVTSGTFRHRFFDNQYEVWGSASTSRLDGSPSAIAQIQRDGVHFLQRPDAALAFDSSRTSLVGDQQELAVGKYGGEVQFETSYEDQSPGYDPNDLGFLGRADQHTVSEWLDYMLRTPRAFYNSWRFNLNKWDAWNTSGQRLEKAYNANTHLNFSNNWWAHVGATLGRVGGVTCDFCSRGGPALRRDAQWLPWLTIQGDNRRRVVPTLNANWLVTDGGRTRMWSYNPTADVRLASRVQASVGALIARNHDNTQWLGNFPDSSGTRSAFALLDQTTRALTLRTSFAMTRTLSLETYAAPFVSTGTYSDVRSLSATPAAVDYGERFTAFTPPTGTPTRFDVRQVRINAVARWEYAPGSTLFVVWSHQADAGVPIRNALTIKASYWIGR